MCYKRRSMRFQTKPFHGQHHDLKKNHASPPHLGGPLCPYEFHEVGGAIAVHDGLVGTHTTHELSNDRTGPHGDGEMSLRGIWGTLTL